MSLVCKMNTFTVAYSNEISYNVCFSLPWKVHKHVRLVDNAHGAASWQHRHTWHCSFWGFEFFLSFDDAQLSIKWLQQSRGEYHFSLKSWSETTSRSEMQWTNYHAFKVFYKIPEKPFQITAQWLYVNEVYKMIDTKWLAAIDKWNRLLSLIHGMFIKVTEYEWNEVCTIYTLALSLWLIRKFRLQGTFVRQYREKLWGSQPSKVSYWNDTRRKSALHLEHNKAKHGHTLQQYQ